REAAAFGAVGRSRLVALAEERGRPGLVVAAYDPELFGHWWFGGPDGLARVLRELPAAGVRVSTLRGALDAGLLGGPVELPVSSWGSGKDWRGGGGARGGGPGGPGPGGRRPGASACPPPRPRWPP